MKNSPEALFLFSRLFSQVCLTHPMESLVYLLHWIFNHLCLREIKEGILLFKIRVQPSPLWLFSLKCADWLNYIFLASFEFDICKLRRYTIAAEIGVLPKVSVGLVWACSFPPCSVQPKALCCYSPVIYPQIDIGSASAEDSWQQLLNSSAQILDTSVAPFPVHPHITLDCKRFSTADLETVS